MKKRVLSLLVGLMILPVAAVVVAGCHKSAPPPTTIPASDVPPPTKHIQGARKGMKGY